LKGGERGREAGELRGKEDSKEARTLSKRGERGRETRELTGKEGGLKESKNI